MSLPINSVRAEYEENHHLFPDLHNNPEKLEQKYTRMSPSTKNELLNWSKMMCINNV